MAVGGRGRLRAVAGGCGRCGRLQARGRGWLWTAADGCGPSLYIPGADLPKSAETVVFLQCITSVRISDNGLDCTFEPSLPSGKIPQILPTGMQLLLSIWGGRPQILPTGILSIWNGIRGAESRPAGRSQGTVRMLSG